MRRPLVIFALFPLLVSGAQCGGQKSGPEHMATQITVKDAPFDDVATILHIWKASRQATLKREPHSLLLRVDFYKAGKKLPHITGVGPTTTESPATHKIEVEVCLQALDLDYLPLPDGPKHHCRLLAKLGMAAMTGFSTDDIPKDTFDFSKVCGVHGFPASASSEDEVPLLGILANAKAISPRETVADFVNDNPNADIAIVLLEMKEPPN
jgi:hypothetical protein